MTERPARRPAPWPGKRHPKAILAVAGESMGGAVAIAAFASTNRPPDADRAILLSPAVCRGFLAASPCPIAPCLWVASHTLPAGTW